MKNLLKWVVRILLVVVVLAGGFVGLKVAQWKPVYDDIPMPNITASTDPVVIARGEYLVNAVAHCAACHSKAEDYFAAKRGEIQVPSGGHEWHMGPLGTLRAPNITPDPATGIGEYTDAELARAIRFGVMRDNTGALMMMAIGPMSDEDLTAIVSYVRSIPPVSHDVPDHELGIMGKVLFQTAMSFFAAPHDYAPMAPPFVKEGGPASVERGRYLSEGPAFCAGCHNKVKTENDQLVYDGPMMGGRTDPNFPDEDEPEFVFVPPNLTKHPTSIVGDWTGEQFRARFRSGRVYRMSPMPWENDQNMTDEDVMSIWMYLESLPPVDHDVGPSRQPAG